MLSPILFNMFPEGSIQDALEGLQTEENGRLINNIRFAYDTVVTGGYLEDLQLMVNRVKDVT